MNYNKLNNLVGWIVWAIATFVFVSTMEPTASFWDCGEFIVTADGLQVGHPPGAPFWMLISRVVISFAPEGMEALSVNLISALSSSFTVLFLFWTITHFAKKIALKSGELTKGAMQAVLFSGAVGSLAFTFSDTFWFSAVEAEVYAMSTFFTAVVFWLMLKWEERANQPTHWRWIILIAYLMGLSIGVHLLNLLAIPAMTFIYYFKRTEKVTPKGILLATGASLLVLGIVQIGIIKMFIVFAGSTERFFVNTLGMGFNSGVIFYIVLVIGVIVGLLWYSRKKGWIYINVATVSIMMALIGYSTFALILVRSSANTPMDENNPENIFTFLSYLNREQYGNRALIFGPYFNTPRDQKNPSKDGRDVWIKSYSVFSGTKKRKASFRWEHEAKEYIDQHEGKNFKIVQEYVESGEKKGSVPNYDKSLSTSFPRMGSAQARHIPAYKEWSNYHGWNEVKRGRDVRKLEALVRRNESVLDTAQYVLANIKDPAITSVWNKKGRSAQRAIKNLQKKLKPTMGENMRFLANYQIKWMWWRYFMWNFSGRQNDMQGHGDFTNGNWITGIDFIDAQKLGNRSELPESVLNNKGFNKFYLLPFILGIIGLVFMIIVAPKDSSVIALLFLMTGVAIILYLNQPPLEPRERDYTFVGSFYAFAIWIGMGISGLYYASEKMTMTQFLKISTYGVGTVVFFALLDFMGDDGFFMTLSTLFVVFVSLVLLIIMFALQKSDGKIRAVVAGVLCLLAPIMMAKDGWDDHSRAKRRTGLDFAKNYLDSLEPNAIIFTNGDNDTFPLWYAQEVEGYRTDVRVVNLSLLNTDWYIDQMKRKAYNSDPVPFKMREIKYRQGTRDAVYIQGQSEEYMNVADAMEVCLDDSKKFDPGTGTTMNYLPTNKFRIPVDSALVVNNGTVRPEDAGKIVPVEWVINKQFLYKASMMVLDLLANNNWERPIYFAVTTGGDAYMGLDDYFQLEGLAYRLVPIKHKKNNNPNIEGGIASDIMYNNMMNKFQWGNMEDSTGMYMDETNRRMVTNLRLQFNNLADKLIEEKQGDKALKVLDKCVAVMPEKNVAYDRVMLALVDSYLKLGIADSLLNTNMSLENKLIAQKNGEQLAVRLFEIVADDLNYYMSLEPKYALQIQEQKERIDLGTAHQISQMLSTYFPKSEKLEGLLSDFDDLQDQMQNKKAELEDFKKGASRGVSRF